MHCHVKFDVFGDRLRYGMSDYSDDVYEVQKIIGHRYDSRTNKHFFEVRWTGYEGHDSWEPIEHLNCSALIHEYFNNVNFKKNNKSVQTQTEVVAKENSVLEALKLARPKTIHVDQCYISAPVPDRIEEIDIESRIATVYFQYDTSKSESVDLDFLTVNFPSLVNQFFLDQAKKRNE